MSVAGWTILCASAASAGTYAAALFLAATKRWPVSGLPFAAILTAAAVFAFARIFSGAVPLSALAAIFLGIALAQTMHSPRTTLFAKFLTLVPIVAMLLVALAPLLGSWAQPAFVRALMFALCLPAPIALTFALRNLDLIRKDALDRVR